jgi:hypothetical protein
MPKQTISGLTTFQHFFLEYGPFLAAWNSFDVLIEIALMRELRLTAKEACTVFASVGFGAKHNILGALLLPPKKANRNIRSFKTPSN